MASSSSTPSIAEERRLYEQFFAVLRSTDATKLPLDTLLGAITHYLATLRTSDLGEFVSTILTSRALSSSDDGLVRGLQGAIRLSISVKIDILNKLLETAYFSTYRRDRRANQWLEEISSPVIAAAPSLPRSTILLGLLEGLDDVPGIQWGRARMAIEEELVIEAASAGVESNGLDQLCSTLVHADRARLRALHLKKILPQLQSALHLELNTHRNPDKCDLISQAIGKILEVLNDGGSSSRTYAWSAMDDICAEVQASETLSSAPARLQSSAVSPGTPDARSKGKHREVALSSYLTIASSIVDIIASSEPPSTPSSSSAIHPSAQIAIAILTTLYTFAELIESTSGGLEGYSRVLFFSLDILEAKGGVDGANQLFTRVKSLSSSMTASHAAFTLRLGEQLVHQVNGRILREILFPLARNHVSRPPHTAHDAAFEAAHGMLLAIIQAAIASPDTIKAQRPFIEAVTVSYARLLLAQAQRGDIKPDQFRAAFPIVTGAAAICGTASLDKCVELLTAASDSTADTDYAHAVRITRIGITPHIPRPELSAYLDSLARVIILTGSPPRRAELAESVFRMVIEGLPDDSKKEGMEWWLKWGKKFEEGERDSVTQARARL